MSEPTLVVRTDFEGARLGFVRVQDDVLEVELLYEAPVVADWMSHEYRLHFTFGIENLAALDKKVRVRVGGGRREDLPQIAPMIYASYQPLTGYKPYKAQGATDEFQVYDFDVHVEAGKTLYIANCLPRPLSWLSERFDEIASAGGARRIVYGTSLEGRELVAYEYGSGDKPVVLVSSGTHPPEPDTLATEALMELMTDPVAEELRERFDFVFAPFLNPDGYAHGSQASNAAGINFTWDFRHRDRKYCPEAVHFYALAVNKRPILYFDFHAYTFQWRKHASPYCKPLSRYRDDRVRKVVQKINERILAQVSAGKSLTGFATFAPTTLGEKLTRKFNTITYAKYHIHLKDGEDECRDHAVRAVTTACSVLIEENMADNAAVLTAPFGKITKDLPNEMLRMLQVYWWGYFRPLAQKYYAMMLPFLRRHGLR